MKRLSAVLSVALLFAVSTGANPRRIDAKAYLEHVKFLASDNLEGRGNGGPGLEAAADYIAGLLRGHAPSREAIMKRVTVSRDAEFHAGNDPDLPAADIPCCATIDAFDFAMRVERSDGRLLARPWRGPIRGDRQS